MNLFDRIKNTRRLADQRKKNAPQQGELGTSGDFQTLYNRQEARKAKLEITDIRKMLDNDGTAEAMYNLLTWPIMQAARHFEVEKGGSKELELVEQNFNKPSFAGGVTYPTDLLIADHLRSFTDGFRFYEKVWQVYDGKVMYRKIAPRDAGTMTLLRDEHGGFAGGRQRVWIGSKFVDVVIPVDRAYLFTYAKERDYLYGRSPFTSAYYHYDKKHKLYYLQQLGGEVAAVPGKVMQVPDAILNNPNKAADVLDTTDTFGGIDSSIVIGKDWDLKPFESKPVDLQKSVDHHDTLMARSILSQFIVLAGSSTGSYSLGESDKENFLMALQGVMKQIEHHFNTYIIPPLIDYNFGSGIYPTLKFEDISSNTKKIMGDAFTAILGRQDIPGYIIEGIAEQVGRELGIEPTGSKTDNNKPDPAKSTDGNIDGPVKNNSDEPIVVTLADGETRPATPAEKRVNIKELTKKIDAAEEKLLAEATEFYDTLKDTTIKAVTALINKDGIAGLGDFTLSSFVPYRRSLEAAMMNQYNLGKRTAADEIGGKIPQTPKQSRDYIKQQARAVADKQASDLLFAVKTELTKDARTTPKLSETRELSLADALARIAGVFTTFVTNSVTTGVAVSLAGALNVGRQDSFGASSDIDRMQYSAILDLRTTPMCRSLDSSVVSYEEYLATQWKPPVHFRCRSIWVAILKDDSFKPEFRPIPAAPGGYSSPLLSDTNDAIVPQPTAESKELEERARRALEVLEDAA